MAKARLLFRSKILYPEGAVREMVIWDLPHATQGSRHRLKYRLYYGDENGKCLVRYDNEAGKGDHRHNGHREASYRFVDVETLIADFQKDINDWRALK